MTYHQITSEERYTLGVLRQQGRRPAAIARALGRHRSTIGREVRRNQAHSDQTYRPQLAEWYARGRRSQSRRNRRFSPEDWARVQALVREDWSPEQVAGRLRRQRELQISHETIYRYCGRTRRRAAPCTVICAGRASSAGNATGATTAGAGSPASAPLRRARPSWRRGPRSDTGKGTRS